MTEKVGYTAVPFEDSQVLSERELPPYNEKPRYTGPPIDPNSHECCYQNCQRSLQRRKAWRRALLIVLMVFLGGRFLLAGLSFFMFSDLDNSNFSDQYIWIQVPGLGPNNEPEIGSPEVPYYAPPIPEIPEPVCEPTIRWNGPSELLLDPIDVTGLIFKIKGTSARGSVIIRQDPKPRDHINITSEIYLSDDTLQEQVDIRIDIVDNDYSITVEVPRFANQKCVQVDTIITIPNQIRFFRTLLVEVPNSWILATGLEAIDFAYINLRTKNGHIRADGISAAIAEIATVNGHLQGVYTISESLDARTVSGAITITPSINPTSDEASVTVKSINGHIDVAVHELTKKQVLDFKAETVNGGVIATIPDSYRGDFSLSTLIGYSYVEGQDITYVKKTQNVKIGHKGKKDDDDDDDDDDYDKKKKMHKKLKKMKKKAKKSGCRHNYHDEDDGKTSRIAAETVTGAVELYFL